jgi:hypothetical protein
VNVVENKITVLEKLLKKLVKASEDILVASNGLSDNEWTVNGKTYRPMWPNTGFGKCLKRLDQAYSAADDYFNPPEAESRIKWENACATASFIVDRFNADMKSGASHPNLVQSSLHRNIADAINGTLKQTGDDRLKGKVPETMTDHLNSLVANGELVELGVKK